MSTPKRPSVVVARSEGKDKSWSHGQSATPVTSAESSQGTTKKMIQAAMVKVRLVLKEEIATDTMPQLMAMKNALASAGIMRMNTSRRVAAEAVPRSERNRNIAGMSVSMRHQMIIALMWPTR